MLKTKLAEYQERSIETENNVENAKEELNSSKNQIQVLLTDKLVHLVFLWTSKQLQFISHSFL
jgi:hypothetical protein